nr:hypothetical protein [Tanacetum cinerariifolium]
MRYMGFASWDLDKLTWEGRVEGYGTILVCVCAQEVAVERGGILAGKLGKRVLLIAWMRWNADIKDGVSEN